MSEPIGSVYVDVRPDARDFARRFREQTGNDADQAGAEFGRRWSRSAQAEIQRNPLCAKVDADTAAAQAQVDRLRAQIAGNAAKLNVKADTKDAQFQMHALADAIALIGPAAIPVAAVAGGALLGLIPVAATVALGIAGIDKQLKASAQQGTQFANTVNKLKTELGTLEQTASGGIVAGLNKAMRQSSPLFATVNKDVGVMSAQLGQIVGGAGPALVSILTQLDPLFSTIGTDLAAGAQHLEQWAHSTTGIQSFVAYVQAELPAVEHTLGELITLVAHLGQGLAPLGHVALTAIGALAKALDAIPIGVLSQLEPAAISAYLAFRTYSGITAIVAKVSGAITGFQEKQAASAAVAQAQALRVQAAYADEAAVVTAAKAAEARATADAALQIAAAQEGTGSILEQTSLDAALAADQFAIAMQAEADAAVASAAEIGASADAAAGAIDEAGATASLGWAGMLGPLAAVAVGVGLFTAVLGSNNKQAEENQKIMDGYANSLQQSANALADVNIQQTAKNLKDSGAIDLANQLKASNDGVTLGYGQLALAVNGSKKQFDAVYNSLTRVAKANVIYSRTGAIYNDTGKAANDLAGKLKQLRGDFTAQMKIQQELAQVQRQANVISDGGATAAAKQARQLGLSTNAYLDAQTAAKKNTQQTKQQTAAFQAENDAASLLQQALDGLAGTNLSVAQANTAVKSANLQVIQSFQHTKDVIKGSSQAAVAHQQSLEGEVSAAQQAAEAIAKADKARGHAARAERDEIAYLKQSKQTIEDELAARGKLTPAVKAYIDNLYNLKGVQDYLNKHPTVADANTTDAERKVKTLQYDINQIRQGKVPGLDADTQPGHEAIAALQREIDSIKQHRKPSIGADTSAARAAVNSLVYDIDGRVAYVQVRTAGGGRAYLNAPNAPGRASGGGLPEGVSAVGERGPELAFKAGSQVDILSNSQSKAFLSATGMRAPGFAGGTLTPAQQSAISRAGAVLGGLQINLSTSGWQKIDNQLKHAAAVLTAGIAAGLGPKATKKLEAQLQKAVDQANHQLSKLRAKIDDRDLKSFDKAVKGTAADERAAFHDLLNDALKAGISDKFADFLRKQSKTLQDDIRARNKLAQQLDNATNRLTADTQKLKQEAATVRDAITGSFDITSAGTGFNGSQVTGANILAQQKQAANRAKEFVQDIEKLSREGLNKAYLRQLAEAGPSSLPEAQALLSLNPKQFKQLNAEESQILGSGKQLGGFIGDKFFGHQVAHDKAVVATLKQQLRHADRRTKHAEKAIVDEIRHAAALQKDRKEYFIIDGKVVRVLTKAVNDQNHKDQRR